MSPAICIADHHTVPFGHEIEMFMLDALHAPFALGDVRRQFFERDGGLFDNRSIDRLNGRCIGQTGGSNEDAHSASSRWSSEESP